MKQSNIACEIFPTDLKRWLDEDFGVLLVSTGVAVTKEAREAFLFIDRKEDYIKKQKFKLQVYLDDVVKINPSLALVDDKEMQQCMFFNSLTNNCSIYQYRPISCRCYPYGLNPSCEVTTGKEFCGEERFVPGKQENWKEQEGDLKITWANIHGLQLFLKSRISGNIGYQDTKKHKESRVKVEMQKRNEAINMIVGLYQNFITTFCFLYPELVNIEEVSREMQNDKPI